MNIHSSKLREKDVINVCSGRRLGFVCDFLIDCDCGKITAVLVSDNFFALGSGKNTICIPWEKICCIGNDAILVQIDEKDCPPKIQSEHDECRKRKGSWLFG